MVDYSFIRLEPTFEKAKYTRNSPVATIVRNDFIQLLPNEVYLQTTSLKDGIAFDGNYAVKIVDCTDAELADVTTRVAIEQFTDSNGIPQIRFELANLGVDFYKREICLKFIHTVSNAVWWSNPFIITSYLAKTTTRFDYLKYGDTYYNSIRLACYFDVNDAESTASEYTTINGLKVTSRLIKTEFEKYKFDRIDNFTYRRLNEMLSQTVVYVNSYRMTDKVVSASTERAGDSNFFNLDFKAAMNYSEEFEAQFQIFEPLTFTTTPIDNGSYTPQIPLIESVYSSVYSSIYN